MKKLPFFSLVILIVAAIDNIKNLPAMALNGPDLIPLFLLSAFLFLIPTALVSASLSAAFPMQGGIYEWVKMAFNAKWGMAAIWLQWINTIVWYPSMLTFIAATLGYLVSPKLAESKLFLAGCVVILYWGLTLVNLKGLRVSSILNNVFTLIGTALPLFLLIACGVIWYSIGLPLQFQLQDIKLFPHLNQTGNWISLIAIMASFMGMELSSVHVNEIEKPKKNFPKALLTATLFIIFTMSLGSLSIGMILPKEEMDLVAGVTQIFNSFFTTFGLKSYLPVIIFLIAIGSIGTMINWMISPAKGLKNAGEGGFLPPFLNKTNQRDVPVNILIIQALLVTLSCLAFIFTKGVSGFFWFLTALSTELYMLMYLLMFVSALKLNKSILQNSVVRGGKWGLYTICSLGIFAASATIVVSFFPPNEQSIGNPVSYLVLVIIGNVITLSPLIYFFVREQKKEELELQNYS